MAAPNVATHMASASPGFGKSALLGDRLKAACCTLMASAIWRPPRLGYPVAMVPAAMLFAFGVHLNGGGPVSALERWCHSMVTG
ncbi:hypothetical protein D3876_19440 [Sphingomonas cavernae]|uniref:Uncharacterized protein n=1 Tax=Sphingomonas cavernae TaxID=2320861 RepID=A0A418W7M8_9SPHN|nr:hypothetical protein D3876_19440 [Sphingomonas cavernae]